MATCFIRKNRGYIKVLILANFKFMILSIIEYAKCTIDHVCVGSEVYKLKTASDYIETL